MKKIAVLIFALTLFVCCSCVYADEPVKSPIGIYSADGTLIFSIGTSKVELESIMGLRKDYVAPYMIFDADEIVLPVITMPEPSAMIVHADVVEALIAAAAKATEPLGVNKVQSVLESFGYGIEDLEAITDGTVFKIEVELNGFPAEKVSEFYDFAKVSYASDLKTYEMQKKIPYEQYREDVRSSLKITSGMLSLMEHRGSVSRNTPTYPSISISYVEKSDNYTPLELMKINSDEALRLRDNMEKSLVGSVYSSIENRNNAIASAFEQYLSKYDELGKEDHFISMVVITGFGYFTSCGEYVGMRVEPEKMVDLGKNKAYTRYYSGEEGHLVELSAEYVASLTREETSLIQPFYGINVKVDDKLFIKQISIADFVAIDVYG